MCCFLFILQIKYLPWKGELIIFNKSYQKNIKIEVYPIGAIFNAQQKYSIECINENLPEYDKIIGGSKILPKRVGSSASSFKLDHDASEDFNAEASIGFGKYRVVFLEFYNDTNFTDGISTYCDVDYSDADYPILLLI